MARRFTDQLKLFELEPTAVCEHLRGLRPVFVDDPWLEAWACAACGQIVHVRARETTVAA